MSLASRRGAALERRTAEKLGGKRVHRKRGESAPDVYPLTLSNGITLIVEAKHRAKLPALIKKALARAARYAPSCVPVAAINEFGGRSIAVMWFSDFCKLAGTQPLNLPKQPSLFAAVGGKR